MKIKVTIPQLEWHIDDEYERDHLGKRAYEAYILARRLTQLFSHTRRAEPQWTRIYHAQERAARRFGRRLHYIA